MSPKKRKLTTKKYSLKKAFWKFQNLENAPTRISKDNDDNILQDPSLIRLVDATNYYSRGNHDVTILCHESAFIFAS